MNTPKFTDLLEAMHVTQKDFEKILLEIPFSKADMAFAYRQGFGKGLEIMLDMVKSKGFIDEPTHN